MDGLLVWTCIYIYAASSILLLTGFVFSRERLLWIATWALLPAFLAHTAIFIMRWARTGYFPANGDLENAITGGWFAIAFTLALFARTKKPVGAALFTVPATLILLGYGMVNEPNPLPLSASFKSSWLIVHVLFAQVAFGSYAITSGYGIVYLLKSRPQAEGRKFYDRFPSLDALEETMFRFVVYGFICEAIMIPAGAIWAKDLWGSYWTWDPVETWSLVSWLLYGLVIHLRVTLKWKGRKLAWLMVFLLLTVIITYWGIDALVQSTRHMFGVTR